MTSDCDPTLADEAEQLLDQAEKCLRRALGLFADCTTESLLGFAHDTGPVLAKLGKAVSDNAQHIVGCRFPDNERTMTVRGVEYERSRPGPSRTSWRVDDWTDDDGHQHVGLLRVVLDSRLADPESGEIADESELEKVRACWNLGTPRMTALRERGIDPDKFCHKAWPEEHNWKVVPAVTKQRRRK